MSFTDADTTKLMRAAEADARIRRGDHFSDWLALGTGLVTLRDVAMREARTNKPYGRAYTSIMGDMIKEHPWANRDKATKSHAMWLADNAGAVIAWRDTLAQNKREQLNHPTVIKRNFERTMIVKETKPAGDKPPTPHDRIKELQGELADKEERLAHLEGKAHDGAGFDLTTDTIEDIKAVIDRLPHKSSLKTKLKAVRAALDAWLTIPAKR